MALVTMTHRDSYGYRETLLCKVHSSPDKKQPGPGSWPHQATIAAGRSVCAGSLAAAPGRGGGGGWRTSLGWGRTKQIAYLGWREEFGFYSVTGKMNSD